jgi:hypothetical protein
MANETDPWAQIAAAYGLGAPPAQGLPSTLPGVQMGAAPQVSTDASGFNDYMNQIGSQIKGAYAYDTPQAQTALLDKSAVPQAAAQQFGTSGELSRLLGGEGFSPEILAKMRANAMEDTAGAGAQHMSQMKRALGQSGLGMESGASAALHGEVARQTGQNQGRALRDIDISNAQTGVENMRFGVGQQSQIGMSNMQQANQMAMNNANMMFEALRANQASQNQMAQFNTGIKADQAKSGASAQSNFLGQQGSQWQDQRQEREMTNNQNNVNFQRDQTQYDWQKQTMPWQELNNRYGQANNMLGSWGAQ